MERTVAEVPVSGGVLTRLEGEVGALRAGLAASSAVIWCCAAGLLLCSLWLLAGHRIAGRPVPGPRWAAVASIGFSAAWMFVDRRMEGPTLFVVTFGHGLTVSDLLPLTISLVALRRLLSGRPRVGPTRTG